MEEWSKYFENLERLLSSSERHHGTADHNFCEHITGRLEYAIQTCSTILNVFESPLPEMFDENEQEIVDHYRRSIQELITHLRVIVQRWVDYEDILDAGISHQFQAHPVIQVVHTGRRPKFMINKEQIEYLFSLSFTWTEISSILGISRMTLYRYTQVH